MRIELLFTPQHIDEMSLRDRTVVAIDVLRATTSITAALNSGAREVIPSATVEAAVKMAANLASDVTQGYRKSSRGLRLRAAIVASWVLLAIVAFLVAFHTSERDTRATLADTSVGRIISIDNKGNVTSITSSNPNGASISYSYDALNRLADLQRRIGPTSQDDREK